MHKKRAYISHTQFNMAAKCMRQYEYRYEHGIICAPGGELIQGSSLHDAGEHNLRQKIESKVDLHVKEVKEVFSAAFDKRIEAASDLEYLDDVKSEIDWTLDPGKTKDQGIGLVETFHQQVAPILKPAEVELEVGLEGTADHRPLFGKIDCVEDDGTIIDFKYQKISPSQASVDQNMQLTFYSLMTSQSDEDQKVRIDAVVKNKTPVHKRVDSTRTENQRLWGLVAIAQVEAAIDSGSFYPRNFAMGNMMCSKKYCGYWKICGAGGGKD